MSSLPRGAGPTARRVLPLVLVILVIAWLTLTPSTGGGSVPPALCLLCGGRGAADLTLNLVLFLPLGVALGFAGADARQSLLGGLLLSAGIELLQSVIPGRAPTLRDVLANGVGAGIGALLAVQGGAWLARPRFPRLRLALATCLPGIAVVATAALGTPFATPETYFGQWSPSLGSFAQWTGTVSHATLGGRPIAAGRLATDDALRRRVRDAGELHIQATAGSPPTGLAPILAIADSRSEHLLLIGQEGRTLVVRRFLRASQLRLDTPTARFDGAFAGIERGSALEILVTRSGPVTCATVNGGARCTPRPAASALWSFFLGADDVSGAVRTILGLLTFATLFAPLGALAARSRPSVVATLALVALALTIAAAIFTHLRVPTVAEVAGAIAGCAAATFGGRALRQHHGST